MKKYEILGENLPVVVCELSPGESMITESGSMSWMSPNMKMETTTGGGMKKMLGRLVSGDSAFQNKFTAEGGDGFIAVASSFPGAIKALNISAGRSMIVQKSAFLAFLAERGSLPRLFERLPSFCFHRHGKYGLWQVPLPLSCFPPAGKQVGECDVSSLCFGCERSQRIPAEPDCLDTKRTEKRVRRAGHACHFKAAPISRTAEVDRRREMERQDVEAPHSFVPSNIRVSSRQSVFSPVLASIFKVVNPEKDTRP